MKTHTLTYSCLLNTSVDRACAFHTDTHNLPLITPPWISVDVVSIDLPMHEGSRVVLDIKRFGIKTRWEMEIAKLDCPYAITDMMISGPFPFFRHERHFLPLENGETLMRETLSIVLPFGWLGDLFFRFIQRDMNKMFEFRHRATQQYILSQLPNTSY